MNNPVYTSVVGRSNAELISEVCRLYAPPGARIMDMTYGRGTFWRNIPKDTYILYTNDLMTPAVSAYDFRKFPEGLGEFYDICVLDPPYMHDSGRPLVNAQYQNRETTRGMSHRAIIEMYGEGMREGMRLLKPGGLLWVKCQDEVVSGKQARSTIEIWYLADALGLLDQDCFYFTQAKPPVLQHKSQKHARKNMSVLWVFRKQKREGTPPAPNPQEDD